MQKYYCDGCEESFDPKELLEKTFGKEKKQKTFHICKRCYGGLTIQDIDKLNKNPTNELLECLAYVEAEYYHPEDFANLWLVPLLCLILFLLIKIF